MTKVGRKAFVNRDYVKDEFVTRWLTGLSEKTKLGYVKGYKQWLDFIGLSPKEQIQKRMKDTVSQDITQREFFEVKFREYKEYLEKKGIYTSESLKSQLKIVASFFSRNGLPLSLKRGDWESTMKQEVIKKWIPKNEDIKRFYAQASVRDRALLLTLYHTGFSEADVCQVKISDVKDIYTIPETEHYFIEKPREKEPDSIQATCISFEALHDIRAMLRERNNPTEGYLFVSQTKGKGEPIETRTIHEAMRSLVEKAYGIEKAKDFKTKSLRSAYNSALLRANIQPQELKDLLMGHMRASARKHYAYDEITIKEAYQKAFEFLTINGIQTRQDLAKLREEIDATTRLMSETIASQQKKLEVLEQALTLVTKMLEESKAKLEGQNELNERLLTDIASQKKAILDLISEVRLGKKPQA